MRKAICTAGAACDLAMWRKRMWMPPGCMRRADSVRGRGELAGGARVGIGTRGSTGSLLFRETESSIAPSVGDFIRRGGCTTRRFLDMATVTNTFIITLARTCAAGAPARTTWRAGIILAASTADRDRWDAGFSPGPG